ncbi:hypothetical protein B0H19DRAFT_1065223 [Mycena capillaripes]|nr:hypothetical protein B0H19DRAFT_1065223 [Mycena capillaripes]
MDHTRKLGGHRAILYPARLVNWVCDTCGIFFEQEMGACVVSAVDILASTSSTDGMEATVCAGGGGLGTRQASQRGSWKRLESSGEFEHLYLLQVSTCLETNTIAENLKYLRLHGASKLEMKHKRTMDLRHLILFLGRHRQFHGVDADTVRVGHAAYVPPPTASSLPFP